MVKFLYLMRHAQSAEKQSGQADKDRELTSFGVKEALQMGAFLSREKISFEILYTSTAARASATAQLISDALKFDPEKIQSTDELFHASVRTFLEFIQQIDDQYSKVMCVGHNPVLSYLSEYITKAEIGDVATAGLVMIKFNLGKWKDVNQGNGELLQYVQPSMFVND